MNPYRLIERIGNIAFIVFCVLIALIMVTLIGVTAAEDWGWWALLLIPGIPIGVVLFWIIFGTLASISDKIGNRWRRAKWQWEERQRNLTPAQVSGRKAGTQFLRRSLPGIFPIKPREDGNVREKEGS